MTGPLVNAVGVRKSFHSHEVLKGVDLSVDTGQVLCLIGPSGSGKSTMLRCINHLETISGGYLTVDGQHVGYERRGTVLREIPAREAARRRAEIGMVFQQFNLFPHLTVVENIVEAPIRVRKQKTAPARARAAELLDQVGLAHKADAYPRQLSGGQQQRVAIARALAMDPKLMLFDEPTSALDPELVGDVLAVMADLARSGMTMLVVTHEMEFARAVADEIVFMAEGRIVERGRPDDVLSRPTHERTRSFLARVSTAGRERSSPRPDIPPPAAGHRMVE
ncbi:amino acid ABC transporter ATP-binding protein [Cryptosporangium sp. NPDC048952]|uniref:amino acid ABC transporter ATP-binding protein n=1 Tax=Cryptosporangium sp. NPDC048952 TaxID=3363961 RepID=UPI00371AE499